MDIDPPFTLPRDPSIPTWAHLLYGWVLQIQTQVDTLAAQVGRITATLSILKENVMTTQEDVDAIVVELNGALDEINAKIAELEQAVAAGQAVDLSGLKAAADRLRDVVPDAPVDQPPAG